SNTSVMDAALGISGYSIDTFEQTPLLPGLTVTLTGGVPVTVWTSLPNLFDVGVCGQLSAGEWDGTHAAASLITNQVDNCFNPSSIAGMTTFAYAPGATSFGLGFGNSQSLSPPSPDFPTTNHELFVNGVDLGVI